MVMANINRMYPKTSPYYNSQIVNNNFLDVLQFNTTIPVSQSDAKFTITSQYEFRPDLLAQHLYNDPRLWWVFAARNPNQLGPDPYFNFVTGITIRVPPLSTIQSALGI
tara:strand:+ start:442 stop:768 length:327 start_codon:yes stop_codon:yes gene_type:complete